MYKFEITDSGAKIVSGDNSIQLMSNSGGLYLFFSNLHGTIGINVENGVAPYIQFDAIKDGNIVKHNSGLPNAISVDEAGDAIIQISKNEEVISAKLNDLFDLLKS